MTRGELLAYLAGIVDGEGYVGIKKSTAKHVTPGYHERIQIRMTAEPAISLFAETFGGNYYREKPHANNGKPLYCYQASDAIAAEILRQLLPYLRVKHRVACEVLELRAMKQEPKTWRVMPRPEHLRREQAYLRCKAANRVGGGDAPWPRSTSAIPM